MLWNPPPPTTERHRWKDDRMRRKEEEGVRWTATTDESTFPVPVWFWYWLPVPSFVGLFVRSSNPSYLFSSPTQTQILLIVYPVVSLLLSDPNTNPKINPKPQIESTATATPVTTISTTRETTKPRARDQQIQKSRPSPLQRRTYLPLNPNMLVFNIISWLPTFSSKIMCSCGFHIR